VNPTDRQSEFGTPGAYSNHPLAIRTIYGMNFDHIPVLSGLLGYPFGLALMVSVCARALSGLQRRGWS